MNIIKTIQSKIIRWKKMRYFSKIESFFEKRNWYELVLKIQGSDQEYCNYSVQLYNAGYVSGRSPMSIAIIILESIEKYNQNRESSIVYLKESINKLGLNCIEFKPDKKFTLPQKTGSDNVDPILRQRAIENLNIINSITNQLLSEISHEIDNLGNVAVSTKLGSLGESTASMMRTQVTFFVFGIHSICKIRHNSEYLLSKEYVETKKNLIVQISNHIGKILDVTHVKNSNVQSRIQYLVNDVQNIEVCVRSFCLELRKNNTINPNHKLISWFKSETGITNIAGKPFELREREILRAIYDMIYSASTL